MLRPFEISFRTVLDILNNNWQLIGNYQQCSTAPEDIEPDNVRPGSLNRSSG